MDFNSYMKNMYLQTRNNFPINKRVWKLSVFKKRQETLTSKIKNLNYIINYNKNLKLNFSNQHENKMEDNNPNNNTNNKNEGNNVGDNNVGGNNLGGNNLGNNNDKLKSEEKEYHPEKYGFIKTTTTDDTNNPIYTKDKQQLQATTYNPIYSGLAPNNAISLIEFFIPSMGYSFYDFNCLLNKTHLDGLVYVNLNDMISNEFLKNYFSRRPKEMSMDEMFKEHLDIMTAFFYLQLSNFQIVFYLDVVECFSNFILLEPSPPNKAVSLFKNKINDLLNEFMNWNDYSFLAKKKTSNPFYRNSSYFNYIVSYQKDSFQLSEDGVFTLVSHYINYNAKYLSTRFNDFVFLCGKKNKLDFKDLSNPVNSTFISSVNNNVLLISFDYLLENKFGLSDNMPKKTYSSIAGKKVYNTETNNDTKTDEEKIKKYSSLYSKEFLIMERLIETHKESMRSLYSEYHDLMTITAQNIVKYTFQEDINNNIILGMNLHPIFDKQMISNLKYLWETYLMNDMDYYHNSNNKTDNNNLTINGVKYKEHVIELKIDSLMDLFTGKMLDYTSLENPESPTSPKTTVLPKDMKTTPVTTKKGKKKITGVVKIINFNIPPYFPEFDVEKCKLLQQIKYDKSLEGENGNKVVYVITGFGLSFKYFQDIFHEIINNAENYNTPNNLKGKFIDFDINPMLRVNMGYENYMANFRTDNNSFVNKKYFKNNLLYKDYSRFVKTVRKDNTYYNRNKREYKKYKKECLKQCCDCCKCSAKLNLEYLEWKYLPIWSEDVYEKVLEDEIFWALRC